MAVPRQDDRKEADYIRCLAFDKLANAIYQHCAKVQQFLCKGRLQVSTSMDEATKQVKYHHTVVVSSINFLHDPNISSPSIYFFKTIIMLITNTTIRLPYTEPEYTRGVISVFITVKYKTRKMAASTANVTLKTTKSLCLLPLKSTVIPIS